MRRYSILMILIIFIWFGVFVVILNPLSYSSDYEMENSSELSNKDDKKASNLLYILFKNDYENNNEIIDSDSLVVDSDKNAISYDSFLKRVRFRKHVIKSGDTIIGIAKKYNINTDTIISYNSITNNRRIQIGQVLVIPSSKGILHEVKRGENLWTIVNKYKKYSVKIKDVIYANDISDKSQLFPGEKLFIPGAKLIKPYLGPDVFAKPVAGVPTSKVGMRLHPIKRRYIFHAGLDIKAKYGSPVMSVKSGRVKFAGWKGGYGKLIIISHGKRLESRYGHLSRILVRRGMKIRKRQLIGRVGSTGLSTGPHLHFEMRKNNRPQKILKKFKGLYGNIGVPW